MKTLHDLLKEGRIEKNLKHKDVVAATGIDQSLLSKYENGSRLPTESHIMLLANVYGLNIKQLRVFWVYEKFIGMAKQYEIPMSEIMYVAEGRAEFLYGERALEVPPIPTELEAKLAIIDELKDKWQAAKPLNNEQLRKLMEYFNIEYTYESNRIEGNTLSLQETSLVVNQGLTIGSKSMREHLEAINHAEAAEFIGELATQQDDVTKRTLLELHGLILKSIDRENAGRWRSVPVRISGSQHAPPEPYMLDKMMEDYFIHYSRQKGRMHPVILAAEMHERLVSIHPFIDGNGRTSRLVMNLVLLRNGYTIANLKGDNASRLAYYQALEKVQVDNEPEAFYHLVANAVETSLRAHLALV
ncbi:MAG: Fic family protein [Saprospiraceae bacterium]|nr:Fic family protein [Saprospiraceae bacterium]MCF8250967.1 Fic family protein [Saprospiraceae bacterium]MCF8280296.1 Fic family protein [Bacteroidales bacterium]MCF8312823.1 Fic family protein [Saprospiraceae bacterium]MCF8441270.1 Fic family protein [Saprospiraceae bacterium]